MVSRIARAQKSRFPLARRLDLKSCPGGDSSTWLVEDPAASRYYELSADELFLLRQFDGRTSPAEICDRYDRAFAPRRLQEEQLGRFAARLHHWGLLISTAPGQAEVLRRRALMSAGARRLRAWGNPLAIRLTGFDPGPILSRLMPWCDGVFSRKFLGAALLLCAIALGIAMMRGDALIAELRTAAHRFNPNMLFSLAAVTVAAKVVHELAHALVCRKFGGNCREIGVLLLVGMPCLYCDVTSIWMIPERRKRMLVGAAGILVELLLAAGAVVLWNASAPGLFHDLCLQLAVVCSVATVLFNGNPLLRYDGYFVLTDLVGITNLAERSDAALRMLLGRWYCGDEYVIHNVDSRMRRSDIWAAYALCSWAYRLVLTLAVWWFLRKALMPFGLTFSADAVLLLTLFGMVVWPVKRMLGSVRDGLGNGQVDGRRLSLRGGATLLVAMALLLWPWPNQVAAPAVAYVQGGRHLFVAAPGVIESCKQLGDVVGPGELVARLSNVDLDLEVARLQSDAERKRAEVGHLERRRIEDPTAGDELPAARKASQSADERLRLCQMEFARLRITAPIGGKLLPLPQSLAHSLAGTEPTHRQQLSSSPLESENRGRFLVAGTPLCTVGDAARREAVLVVDQRDIELVRPDAAARCRFDATGTRVWRGRVVESTVMRAADAPPELVAAGQLALESSADGSRRPVDRYFLVRVVIEEDAQALPIGAVGEVRIDAAGRSLLARGWRVFTETFRSAGAMQ